MGEYADEAIERMLMGGQIVRHCRSQAIPAGPVIKALRHKAHLSFDRIWREGLMSRTQAYYWLAKKLGIPERGAHMGRMIDEDILYRTIKVSDELYGSTVIQNEFPDDLGEYENVLL
jgi:hypothetical protein